MQFPPKLRMKSCVTCDQAAGPKSSLLVSKTPSEGASSSVLKMEVEQSVAPRRSEIVDPVKVTCKRIKSEDRREATLQPPKKRICHGYGASAMTSGVDRQLDVNPLVSAKQDETRKDFQDLKNHCQIALFFSNQLLNKCLAEMKKIQEIERDKMQWIHLFLHNAGLSPVEALRVFNESREASLKQLREIRSQLQSELDKIQHGFPSRPCGISSQQDTEETKPAWKSILRKRSDTRKAIELVVQEIDETIEGYHAGDADDRPRAGD